jgi:hypothetical protein
VNTLNKCVLSAEHEKDFLEKKRKNEVADAARALVAKKEADGAKAIEKVTSAWDERIELRVAAEEKMKVAIQDEKIKQEKLRKRKVDTEAQATREVQTDVLKAAAKRQKTNDAGETATATATETATEMQEEDGDAAAAQAGLVEQMAAAAPVAAGLAAAVAML